MDMKFLGDDEQFIAVATNTEQVLALSLSLFSLSPVFYMERIELILELICRYECLTLHLCHVLMYWLVILKLLCALTPAYQALEERL